MGIETEIEKLCRENEFMNHNHITLKTLEKDHVVMELVVRQESLNPYKIVHGGALYTMADCAAGTASRSDGRRYVTMSSSLNFLRSGLMGDTIWAEARIRHRGRTVCYVEVDVTNQKGELLASGDYTFFCIENT